MNNPRFSYQSEFHPDFHTPQNARSRIPVTQDLPNRMVSDTPKYWVLTKLDGVDHWQHDGKALYLDYSMPFTELVMDLHHVFQVKIQGVIIKCEHTSNGNLIREIEVLGDQSNAPANTMQIQQNSTLAKMLRVLKLTSLT